MRRVLGFFVTTVMYFLSATILPMGALVSAQQYRFFPSDAMSSSLVTSFVQDADGYLWVGTEHGLNRFDGYHFTPATLPQARHQTVTTLFCDAQSRLWAGTSHGLLLHDSATDTFLEVHFPGNLAPRVTS